MSTVKSSFKQRIKQSVRQWLVDRNLPITRNLRYDILTKKILQRELSGTANCVDVGAHKGEILDLFLQFAPQGKHSAFEPIPPLFNELTKNYGSRVNVHPYALSNRSGNMLFNVVLDAPAYSGLQRREYASSNPTIETIEVEVRPLDDVLQSRSFPIQLIKIDVEGGELDVLKGAQHILSNDKPLLIFEFGKGASEYYGTMPHHLFDFLSSLDYALWTLGEFWENKKPLDAMQLKQTYESGSDYYFVARCTR